MGGKGKAQKAATNEAASANALDKQRAAEMEGRLSTLRGYGTDFAETGGFSPQEKESFIRRSTSAVPAYYERQKQDLSRRLALQGGFMPGYTASQARLGRYGAQDTAKATTDAQVELANQVRAGKLAGTGILSNAEELAIRNRLTALGASKQQVDALLTAASQQKDLMDSIKGWAGMAGGAMAAM